MKISSRTGRIESGIRKIWDRAREMIRRRETFFGLLVLAVCAAAVGAAGYRQANNTFGYKAFKSDQVPQQAEKIIDNDPSVDGIFVYGPYISLLKGDYQFQVSYSTDEARDFEVTAEYGGEQLYFGTLMPGQETLDFAVTVPEDITDNTVELRVRYGGSGYLEFRGMSFKKSGWLPRVLLALLFFGIPSLAAAVLLQRLRLRPTLYTALLGTAGALLVLWVPAAGFVTEGAGMAVLFLALFSEEKRAAARALTPGRALLFALTAYLIVSAYGLFRNPELLESVNALGAFPIAVFCAAFLTAVFGLAALYLLTGRGRLAEWLLLPAAGAFGLAVVVSARNRAAGGKEVLPLTVGVIAILFFMGYYLTRSHESLPVRHDGGKRTGLFSGRTLSYRAAFAAACAAALGTAVFFTIQTVSRYRIFGAANFDLGIFAQMYENMAKSGLPVTTCERGFLVSHFYIHFSPVYYLFLPVYLLHRSPETLLAVQSFMVSFAVIPLFLICRAKRLPPHLTLLVSLIYLMSPAMMMPLYYDFHENAFFPFFLFWFVYFFITKRNWRALLFLLFSLSVKEEAAVYTSVLAVYFILEEKERKRGLAALLISVVWFAAVMAYIRSGGLGLMEGHYGLYYRSGETGVAAMARNILLDPGFFIKNVFAAENIPYIFYTAGALLFVPLASRSPARLLLLVPYAAFGLMTNYAYQHDVGYQYTYGPMALMMFLFILNLADLNRTARLSVLLASLTASVLLCYTYKGDRLIYYAKAYGARADYFDRQDAYIASLDFGEHSVAADSFMVPHLYRAKELYDVDILLKKETDYVLVHPTVAYGFFTEGIVDDYELVEEKEEFNLALYRKK